MSSKDRKSTKFVESNKFGDDGVKPQVAKVENLEAAFSHISRDLDKGVVYPPDAPLSARFKIHHPGQEARSEEEDRKLAPAEEEFLKREGFLTGQGPIDMIHYFLYKDCAEMRKFYDYIMEKKERKKRVSEDDRDRCRAFIARLQKVTEKCEYIAEPKDHDLPQGYGQHVKAILMENLRCLPDSLREVEEYISGKGSKKDDDTYEHLPMGLTSFHLPMGSMLTPRRMDVPLEWTYADAEAMEDDDFDWDTVVQGPDALDVLVKTFLQKERTLVTTDIDDEDQTWQKVLQSLRACFSTPVPNYRYMPEIFFNMELLGDQSQLVTEAARIVDDAPRNVAYVVVLTNKSSHTLYIGLKVLNNKWPTDFRPVGTDRCDFSRSNGKVGLYKRTMCSQGVAVPKHSQMAIYVTVKVPEDSEPGESDSAMLVATWLPEPRRCSAYVKLVTGRFEIPSEDEGYDSEEEWHREMQSAAVMGLFKRFGDDLVREEATTRRKSFMSSRNPSLAPSRMHSTGPSRAESRK